MFYEYVNELHKGYLNTIDEILEKKLRSIGFKGKMNIAEVKSFIDINNIELTVENKPMLTIYKAIDYSTRNELFIFHVVSSIFKEDDKYVLKTEFLGV